MINQTINPILYFQKTRCMFDSLVNLRNEKGIDINSIRLNTDIISKNNN